jgi:D-glycero-D-manno-heptose 1,7-bisphosphate phosphatase
VNRYVFLDRDGTLIEDRGYAHRVSDCHLLPGVAEGLQRLRSAGFGLVIVTNQSGIGHGYFTRPDFDRFQEHLLDVLRSEGVEIDAKFLCPHGPDEGCACRKPAVGMLEQAQESLSADLTRCWVVGDAERDIEMGKRAGCQGTVRVGAAGVGGFSAAVDAILTHYSSEMSSQ